MGDGGASVGRAADVVVGAGVDFVLPAEPPALQPAPMTARRTRTSNAPARRLRLPEAMDRNLTREPPMDPVPRSSNERSPSHQVFVSPTTDHRPCGNVCADKHVDTVVGTFSFATKLPAPGRIDHRAVAVSSAKVAAVAGVLAYNWWVVVPFVPGLMPSINGFFSDLEATGRPHAALMAHADLAAGLLMMAALALRGPRGAHGWRPEWKWMVGFAAAGAVGGRYTYACSEGLSATCRRLEWHLQLPVHHYIHVVSGIAEFALLTTAAIIAIRRTRGEHTLESRVYAWVVRMLFVGYPLLGVAYLTDRLGTLVEPIFFVAFSVMFVAEIFEPRGPRVPSPTWAERVMAREDEVGDSSSPTRVGVTPATSLSL